MHISAALQGMQNLTSPARDGTQAPNSDSTKYQPVDHRESLKSQYLSVGLCTMF